MTPFLSALLVVGLIIFVRRKYSLRSRESRIYAFEFPPSIARKVRATYPHLTDKQAELVMDGLRNYFWVCLTANWRTVSMPSKVVDVAWHEFILFTKIYQQFCRSVFGRYLHHTPSEAMQSPTYAQAGLRRAWRLSCMREHINPLEPRTLPFLFAIDSALDIPDGYRYALDCQSTSDYCASHIGCSTACASVPYGSGCATGDGAGSGDGSGSGDSGSGGGCSGGCGGGCGGGGD